MKENLVFPTFTADLQTFKKHLKRKIFLSATRRRQPLAASLPFRAKTRGSDEGITEAFV